MTEQSRQIAIDNVWRSRIVNDCGRPSTVGQPCFPFVIEAEHFAQHWLALYGVN